MRVISSRNCTVDHTSYGVDHCEHTRLVRYGEYIGRMPAFSSRRRQTLFTANDLCKTHSTTRVITGTHSNCQTMTTTLNIPSAYWFTPARPCLLTWRRTHDQTCYRARLLPGFQHYVSVHPYPYLRVPFQKYLGITFIRKNSVAYVKNNVLRWRKFAVTVQIGSSSIFPYLFGTVHGTETDTDVLCNVGIAIIL